MADENKNQDPEDQKNQASDDDFGLPDFEFDALEDDDDEEEVSTPDPEPSEPAPVESSKEPEATPEPTPDEDVPSIDADDIEGMDLEGLEDVDLGDLEDLGDLGDLDMDDLDLDDLNLDDLDKELGKMDEDISVPTSEEAPQAATADKIEDIFGEPKKKEEKETTSKEEPATEIEDDGLFYEEESFEDFDMGAAEADPSSGDDDKQFSGGEDIEIPEGDDLGLTDDDDLGLSDGDDSGLDMDLGDLDLGADIDSSMFDDDDAPDVEFDEEESAVPFAERKLEGAEGLAEPQVSDEEYGDPIYDEDTSGARSKFVRIVVLGTVLFVAIGFGFLYLNGTLFDGEEPQKVAKTETEKPAKKTLSKEDESADNTAKSNTKETKKAETKPADNKPKKTTPKKTTTKKATPTKKQAVTSSAGVTTLSAKTGRSYLIVASFSDATSAQKHANKLVSQGESPTIIPPFGGAANHRVAVASFGSFTEAADNVDSYRQKLGSGVWVLRY